MSFSNLESNFSAMQLFIEFRLKNQKLRYFFKFEIAAKLSIFDRFQNLKNEKIALSFSFIFIYKTFDFGLKKKFTSF